MRKVVAVITLVLFAFVVNPVFAKDSTGEKNGSKETAVQALTSLKKNAEDSLGEMKDALTRALERLTEAREDKDVVRLNCINERLTAVKGLLKISEQAYIQLQQDVAENKKEEAEHQHNKISIGASKVKQLLVEIQNCMGEMAKYAGETQVDVEESEELPKDDPTARAGASVLTGGGDSSGFPSSDPSTTSSSGYQ